MIIKALLICSGIGAIFIAFWGLCINLIESNYFNAFYSFVGMGVLGVLFIHQSVKDWSAIVKLTEEEEEEKDDNE